MRNRLILFAAIFLIAPICFSQKSETEVLLEKANDVLYDNPHEAIKVGGHIIGSSDSPTDKALAALIVAKGNIATGNFVLGLSNAELAVSQAKSVGRHALATESLLLAAEIYAYLDLFKIAERYRREAGESAGTDSEVRLRGYDWFVAGDKRIPIPDALRSCAFVTKGTALQLAAVGYLKKGEMRPANEYFEKSLLDIRENNRGVFWKILALIDYSDYFVATGHYQKSIELLEQSEELAKPFGNPFLTKSIDERMSKAFLAMGDKSKFLEFRKKAVDAENRYQAQIEAAVNYAFENLQKNKTLKIDQYARRQQNIYWFLGITTFLLLALWLSVRWFYNSRASHLRDIINYLKLIKSAEKRESVKPAPKNLAIPKDTEDLLLAKLEKFENGKKFLNKDISLAQVAAILETNTKYLSEVINKYKKKNFNSYINDLRIAYIVGKLKTDPKYLHYKVSYLAEECGFSSHSIFSAVFKSATGIAPNVFIQFLSKDEQLYKPSKSRQFS